MRAVLVASATSVVALLRSRASLQLEILALRHQLAVLQGSGRRPRLKPADRLLWVWLSRANPSWGSPRIQSQFRKLGLDVAKSTVEKYRARARKPPSPTWRAFLAKHAKELVSLDFFTVATVRFHVLFVLILLAHERRRVVHFNISKYPTAQSTAQQVVEAFPWDSAPRFLLRDRDGIYGADFRRRIQSMGVEEVIIAAKSPWQSPYVERMIGSIRRECLDHVLLLSERHLRRILKDCFSHYHHWRCHQSLGMDCPAHRPIQPSEVGKVVEVQEASGLYRHYERLAA